MGVKPRISLLLLAAASLLAVMIDHVVKELTPARVSTSDPTSTALSPEDEPDGSLPDADAA